MTNSASTNKTAISVGIILLLVIIVLIGYNYWGWFGGKSCDECRESNPENGNKSFALGGRANQQDISQHKSMDFHGASNNNGNKVLQLVGYKKSIFSVGENVKVDLKSKFNCQETKVINGITYKLVNIFTYGGGYFAGWMSANGDYQKPSITKQEYDNYMAKCFSTKTIMAKVVSLLNPPQNSLVEINSPFELQYEMSDGRIYN